MELRKLETFLEVCKTGSISKAGERVYLSQQGVSRIIAGLEKELQLPLFVRSNQGVVPTEAGRVLEKYAEKMLKDYACLQEEIMVLKADAGMCSLGVTPGVLFMYWKVLHELEQTGVELVELYDYQCEEAIQGGQVSMGIGIEPVDRRLFDVTPLTRYPLYVLCSQDNPLSRRDGLSFEDLAGMDLVVFGRKYKGHQALCQCLKKRGFTFRLNETDNAINMYQRCQVKNRVGIALLFPNSSFPQFHLKAIPLQEPLAWEPCLLVKHGKELTKQERRLYNFLLQRLPSLK